MSMRCQSSGTVSGAHVRWPTTVTPNAQSNLKSLTANEPKNAIFTDQSSFSNFALCVIIEKNSTQVAGMTATQWTKAEKITNLAVAALSEPLGKAREEAKKVQDDDIEFKAHAELKKPGEKYTFSGTLSLTMTVYVMNDMQQHDNRVCNFACSP